MTSTVRQHSPEIPLGQILKLPCKFIEGTSNVEKTTIDTIANELATTGKNVMPVMVKHFKSNKFNAIFNNQIFLAARQAKLDFVYCIVVDDQMAEQLEIEVGNKTQVNLDQSPAIDRNHKVNLNQSTEIELITIFESIKLNVAGFSKIDPPIIAQAIIQYRTANPIKSLVFITKLKCGIGKTKLSALVDQLIW